MDSPGFHQPVRLIKQGRGFLHFVDDDPGARVERVQFIEKRIGIAVQTDRFASVEQVIAAGRGEARANPSGFAGSAGAQEQGGATGGGQQSGVHFVYLVGIFTENMPTIVTYFLICCHIWRTEATAFV